MSVKQWSEVWMSGQLVHIIILLYRTSKFSYYSFCKDDNNHLKNTISKSLLYSNFVGEYSYVASGFWCTLLFEHIIICNNALMSHSNSIWEIIYKRKEQCIGIVCLDLSFWAIHSSTQIIMILSWGKCQSSPFLYYSWHSIQGFTNSFSLCKLTHSCLPAGTWLYLQKNYKTVGK